MSLSYLGTDFAQSSKQTGKLVTKLNTMRASATAAIWHVVSAPHVLPAVLRVTSALALSFWLVQMVKHHIS